MTKNQPRTWFLDFDGTLVDQTSHMSERDIILSNTKDFFEKVVKKEDFVIITTARSIEHKSRIEKFLQSNDIKFDLIICELPTGSRILINDKKNDGTLTAYAYNLERDKGIDILDLYPRRQKTQSL
jgi:hydroxymethylpyrimidine pyrophosphatase-like HAD family hydrolase